jgi:hypothetical protein
MPQTTWERRPFLPACIGNSIIAGNQAGKDGRRSQALACPETINFSMRTPLS